MALSNLVIYSKIQAFKLPDFFLSWKRWLYHTTSKGQILQLWAIMNLGADHETGSIFSQNIHFKDSSIAEKY